MPEQGEENDDGQRNAQEQKKNAAAHFGLLGDFPTNDSEWRRFLGANAPLKSNG